MTTQDLLAAIVAKLDHSGVPDSKFPDGKGEHWAHCPFPEHGEDRNATNFSVSERGYYCFVCGAKGGLPQLARHLGIEVPSRRRQRGCTLEAYADAKMLPVGFLRKQGVTQHRYRGRPEIHIPYLDEKGAVVAVRRRIELKKTGSGNDDNRFLWRRGDHGMLYGLWHWPDMAKAGWVLLVEGESDCHTAWLHGLPALGVPGAKAWKTAWASVVKGLDVFLWKEPDRGGDEFIDRFKKSLPEAKVIVPPDGIKDLSAAHIAGRDVVALVEGLKADAVPVTGVLSPIEAAQTLADLGGEIVRIFHDKEISGGRDRNIEIADTLAAWFLPRKRLLLDLSQDASKGGRPYLVGDDKAVWPLERGCRPVERALYSAGLNAAESVYLFVLKALEMETCENGEKTALCRWQYAADNALYVSSGPTAMVRAMDGKLDRVPNGTDGVWFAGDACYPAWRPEKPIEPHTLAAFNPTLEAPSEVPGYKPQVQKALLSAWVAALLSGLRPLPLLVAVGQKGGGKSTLAKAIMHMLMGPHANLTALSDDKRDFWALATTAPVVGLDNLDAAIAPWLPDVMAAVVTGISIDTRELYTNLQKLSRPVTAALVVTTRTASFARPDVAERTLPLTTTEFSDDKRKADSDILGEVDAQRDGLLSWATLTAARLLLDRYEAPLGLPLRFVDFARLVWAYMRSQGAPELAAQMLLSLRQAQALTVGEADPLIEAIVTYCDEMANGTGWQGSASQMVKDLAELGAELPYLGGGKRIVRILREAKATLSLMGIRLDECKDAYRHVTFALRRDQIAQSSQSSQPGKSRGKSGARSVRHKPERLLPKCDDCEDCATSEQAASQGRLQELLDDGLSEAQALDVIAWEQEGATQTW